MGERSDWLFLFVRRNTGRHKKYLPQTELFSRGLRQRRVSQMDGIERPSKQANVHGDKYTTQSAVLGPLPLGHILFIRLNFRSGIEDRGPRAN